MKIEAPVKDLPVERYGRLGHVWQRVRQGAPDWVPVVCTDRAEAHRLRRAADYQGFKCSENGATVYIKAPQR